MGVIKLRATMANNPYKYEPHINTFGFLPFAATAVGVLQTASFFLGMSEWKVSGILFLISVAFLFLSSEVTLCKINARFRKVALIYYACSSIVTYLIGFYFVPIMLFVFLFVNFYWATYVYKAYNAAYFQVNDKAL